MRTACMRCSKNFYISIVFTAIYLSSNSVSARTRGAVKQEARSGQAWTVAMMTVSCFSISFYMEKSVCIGFGILLALLV